MGVQDQAWDLAQLFIWVHSASRTSEHEAVVGISILPWAWVWVPGGSQGWSSYSRYPSCMCPCFTFRVSDGLRTWFTASSASSPVMC